MIKVREAILYDRSDIPFELVIERICQKYHKLPSEVLNEEVEWIRMLLEINIADAQRQEKESMRANMRSKKR